MLGNWVPLPNAVQLNLRKPFRQIYESDLRNIQRILNLGKDLGDVTGIMIALLSHNTRPMLCPMKSLRDEAG
jgi:hypothetical protein